MAMLFSSPSFIFSLKIKFLLTKVGLHFKILPGPFFLGRRIIKAHKKQMKKEKQSAKEDIFSRQKKRERDLFSHGSPSSKTELQKGNLILTSPVSILTKYPTCLPLLIISVKTIIVMVKTFLFHCLPM